MSEEQGGAQTSPSPVEDILRGELPPIPPERRIFVNRNLRMSAIEMIGFDMDYTLAAYRSPEFEQLCLDKTIDKLITKKAYTPRIGQIRFDPSIVQRGLAVDRLNGNILKMDRYNHVWRAFHGREPVPHERIVELYRSRVINFYGRQFAWLDTLFSLPEVSFFTDLVEAQKTGALRLGRQYQRIFEDVRECIDEAHRDDSIKAVVKADPGRHIVKDPALAHTLHRFRSGGKKLFILTNSLWDYTNAVMGYLLNDAMAEYPSWMQYFDIVAVGASKPGFFTGAQPFYEVEPDGPRAGELKPLSPQGAGFVRGRVYHGGNLVDFERLASCGGDRVLYIGDHIYGDILRSKKSSLWRTAMIIPELEAEIACTGRLATELGTLNVAESRRNDLEVRFNQIKIALGALDGALKHADEGEAPELRERHHKLRHALENLKKEHKEVTEQARTLETTIECGYSEHWGSLFREKNETTKFGTQVEDYACLYTSRVSNFAAYSPLYYFLSPRLLLPHEIHV
ncbi:MAG: HAD-IG family 5'-nucleotidase [Deltaproteobacteria bacterium]|nr:HAD-IG family 5'-nucleotidase [Deltaproteobacteria bacterium]